MDLITWDHLPIRFLIVFEGSRTCHFISVLDLLYSYTKTCARECNRQMLNFNDKFSLTCTLPSIPPCPHHADTLAPLTLSETALALAMPRPCVDALQCQPFPTSIYVYARSAERHVFDVVWMIMWFSNLIRIGLLHTNNKGVEAISVHGLPCIYDCLCRWGKTWNAPDDQPDSRSP
jgi:hypothetical protein